MKRPIVLLTTLICMLPICSQAAPTLLDAIIVGEFEKSVQVFDEALTQKIEVKKIRPIRNANLTYLVTISTVGSNYSTCDFSAKAEIASQNPITLIASQSSLDVVRNDRGEWVETPVTCQVSLVYKGDGVSAETNNGCRAFCGTGASLEVSDAKKKSEPNYRAMN